VLASSPGRSYLIRTDGAAWRVRTCPGQFEVTDGAGDGAADVTVTGSPEAVLRWGWHRESPGQPSPVTVQGVPEAVDELHRIIVTATQ
jgi:MDMPI C-terminal domain